MTLEAQAIVVACPETSEATCSTDSVSVETCFEIDGRRFSATWPIKYHENEELRIAITLECDFDENCTVKEMYPND